MDSSTALARAICIKSETSAVLINNRLIELYGQGSVDKGTPQSWKYYLNISGEYHSTDTVMTVTSLDTLEEITFSKQNLVNHTATMQAYRAYNSRYFYSLLNRYPEQVQLIQGILNPANITEAIAAKDGAILSYPVDLVEPQEQTLIKDLEGFIQRHMVRWNVSAYGLTDTLYNLSYHIQLYLTILPKLLNLRLQRCKTNEAHTFHIRQYLASHSRLDRYMPYMTLKQILFFYRNICYLERNAGTVETFNLLVEKLLTDRQIPLAEYSVRHLNSFDEKFYPEIRARRKPLNDQYNVAEMSYVDITDLFEKEDLLVSGNAQYHEGQTKTDILTFKNSLSSIVQTKDLESNMIDYNDAVPDPLEVVLLRQWAYMSTHGFYNVAVSFKDPKTSEFRNVYTRDALIYFYYVLNKSLGIELEVAPTILIEKFRLPVKPNLQTCLEIIDNKHYTARKSAELLWNSQPLITPLFSTQAFFNLSTKLYEECLKQWFSVSNTHDLDERGSLSNFLLQLYGDVKIDLNTNSILMVDWLKLNNLPEYDYTYKQAQELMVSIFNAATGLTIDETKILKNIQRNMLDLMQDLSSYTVQFIREINDSKIRPLNWAAIRSSKDTVDAVGEEWIEVNVHTFDVAATALDQETLNSDFSRFRSHESSMSKVINVKTVLDTTSETSWSLESVVPLSVVYQHAIYPEYDPAVSRNGIVGYEFFEGLSDEEKNSIKSFYN